jgi:hypothetical protein
MVQGRRDSLPSTPPMFVFRAVADIGCPKPAVPPDGGHAAASNVELLRGGVVTLVVEIPGMGS